MTESMDGTLDAHSRHDLTLMTAEDAARKHFEGDLEHQISPRTWWRVAMSPAGEPVGFVLPGRNPYNAVIGYLAVLPRFRGNGYIDEILAEGMRVLQAEDVPRMRAATDVGNVPMAKAFARAGWITFQRIINMTWPDPAAG
jgi:RimJ/RimL family protein N-acetyltransferase